MAPNISSVTGEIHLNVLKEKPFGWTPSNTLKTILLSILALLRGNLILIIFLIWCLILFEEKSIDIDLHEVKSKVT